MAFILTKSNGAGSIVYNGYSPPCFISQLPQAPLQRRLIHFSGQRLLFQLLRLGNLAVPLLYRQCAAALAGLEAVVGPAVFHLNRGTTLLFSFCPVGTYLPAGLFCFPRCHPLAINGAVPALGQKPPAAVLAAAGQVTCHLKTALPKSNTKASA